MMSKAVAYLISVANIIMDRDITKEEFEGFLKIIREHFKSYWSEQDD